MHPKEMPLPPDRPRLNPEDKAIDYNQINDSLYYILMDKTEGQAAVKVKSVSRGEGLNAYYKIFGWYVKTSGQALGARARRAGQLDPVVKEELMQECMGARCAHTRTVRSQF